MSTIRPTSSLSLTPPLVRVKVGPQGRIKLSVSSEKYQKMNITKIVKCSKDYLVQVKQDLERTGQNTSRNIRKFEQQSSNLIRNTDLIIQARQAQREDLRLTRTIALVICAIGSIVLIGIPFLILIRRDDLAFKKEMEALQDNVQAMIKVRKEVVGKYEKLLESLGINIPEKLISEFVNLKGSAAKLIDQLYDLKAQIKQLESATPINKKELEALKEQQTEVENELVSYIHGVQTVMEELKLPFEQAAKYVPGVQRVMKELEIPFDEAVKYIHLRKHFLEVEMPMFSSPEYVAQIHDIIRQDFQKQLSAVNPEGGPQLLRQFQKDISRGITFEFIERRYNPDNPDEPRENREIMHKAPSSLSNPQSADRLGEAMTVIEGIAGEEEIWVPILQAVLTQTGLNGAFLRPRLALTSMEGRILSFREYAIQSEFSGGGLPPIKLEISRNPLTQRIEEVHVTIEGSLDLVKKNMGEIDEPMQDPIIIPNAFHASLSYTLTFDADDEIVMKNFKYESKANPEI